MAHISHQPKVIRAEAYSEPCQTSKMFFFQKQLTAKRMDGRVLNFQDFLFSFDAKI